MSIEELHSKFVSATGVCTDTRKVNNGELFFALKGPSFNGNEFAAKAIDLGCKFAVVDELEYHIEGKTILVNNVLKALQDLAKHHRTLFDIPVVGITGSNGKTTSKELIHCVLNERYKTLATLGNLNNHIGVPLTLLRLNKEHEIAIIEMGANHVGEIAFLCELANPNFGFITNIGKAHIGEFGGFENIIQAKTELYQHIQRKSGLLFVNGDDPLLMEKVNSNNSIIYGNGDYYVSGELQLESDLVNIQLQRPLKEEISSQLFGDYNFSNIMAAISIGTYFEVPMSKVKMAIENYEPRNNRSQILKSGRNTLILDAYNANPTSMMAALNSLLSDKNNAKYAILGDMLELGAYEDEEHQKIIEWSSEKGLQTIFVGEVFSRTSRKPNVFRNIDDLKSSKILDNIYGKKILIKGSRGIKLEQIIDCL